jgi:hypothetical protein
VSGDHLALRQVVRSGRAFPVSGRLSPIPGSARSLNLTPVTGPNQFTNTPGQVAFTPDGSALLVTTKANGNNSDGALTALGNTGTNAGTVDATSAAQGRFLYVQTGGAGVVDEYAVGAGGSLTTIGSVTVAGAVGGEGIAAS